MQAPSEKKAQKKKRSSGLLRQFFRSYIIVLLLPLLIFTFYCINSYTVLKEQTYAGQRRILENTAEQINSVFRDVSRLSSHLQLNRYAAALANPNPSPYFSAAMNSYYLKQDLNYFDANLNLNSISAHFQISSSYLSRRFREQYQKSVVDYLYEVRIANSLPLLANPDLKIADVAQMTGFVDSNAFIRIFKKLKGITPGKYSQTISVDSVSPENNPSDP